MNTKSFILSIYESKQTVFTTNEISILLGERSLNNLKAKLNYYTKKGIILQLRRGLYSKKEYNPFEAGVKLYPPSYISLETVLQKEGVIFQYYNSIHLISRYSKTIKFAGNEFVYKKIKDEILLNTNGILQNESFPIAIKERAFMDAVYLYKEYHFDNLTAIDWEKAREIANIYDNKSLIRRFDKCFLEAKNA